MAFVVFLDTNIYENNGFSLKNSKFTKLKDLVKSGSVNLIYNEIIYQEVCQHMQEKIKDAVAGYNSAIGNSGFAPFRYDEKWGIHLEILNETELLNAQLQN